MRLCRLFILMSFLTVACIPYVGSRGRHRPPIPHFMVDPMPSARNVRDCARFYGLSHPEIVAAQSVLETGHYRSSLCVLNNNLFGLYDSRRNCYRKYGTWQESVKAYKQLVGRKYVRGDYYAFLKKVGYAEDPLYCQKVRRVKNSLKFN